MRAVLYERYGPPYVLHLGDVKQPVPKRDELLVRVHASTVNRLDCHTREANRRGGLATSLLSRAVSGLRRPRQPILGSEFAGEVTMVGETVTEFTVGDKVFGNTGLRYGCHAEYVCVRQSARVGHMPAGANFDEAAPATDGAFNALWCLRRANLRPGQSVLVYGASGAIGTAAVQLASRYLGADVTAVCTAKSLNLVRSLGATRAIDYTREDFTESGAIYNAIFDAVGKHSFKRCRNSLAPGGSYLATDGFRNVLLAIWTAGFGDKKVRFALPPRYPRSDVVLIRDLIESGKYRPVIDRHYSMEDVVQAAEYVETEQKTGNVVLTIRSESSLRR